MLLILGSTISLALDSPRNDPSSELEATLSLLDVVWTAAFTCEMLLKVIAYGFVGGKGTYLSSWWNSLDFSIVTASLLTLAADALPQFAFLQPLKTLRILRVLRPLRLVARDPGMKLIVGSLAQAMPDCVNVVAVVLAIQAIFAILGMQLFMGQLGACTDPTIFTIDECHLPFSPPSPPPSPFPPPLPPPPPPPPPAPLPPLPSPPPLPPPPPPHPPPARPHLPPL